MKDYEEMAKSVLSRRDQYVAERRRQRKKAASVLSCVCLAALVGVGAWRFGALSNDGDTVDNGIMPASEEREESSDFGGGVATFSIGTADRNPAGYSVPTMISMFGETKMASDIAVNNGGVLFSDALTGAMAQYGDKAKYRVIVELFSDGAAIDCADDAGMAEMERFYAAGYTVAFESYNDGYVDHNYFTLHATLEQLENFPAAERYGYCVMLYGERMEITDGPEDAFNGTALAPDAADEDVLDDSGESLNPLDEVWGGSYMDENGQWVVLLTENTGENQQKVFARNPDLSKSTTTFRAADYSLDYLTKLLADVSEGMRDGKLSFVSSAALMVQDNRVAVTLTTNDADKAALIRRFDTAGGAIEIRYDAVETEALP
jgi:hypothetical protein